MVAGDVFLDLLAFLLADTLEVLFGGGRDGGLLLHDYNGGRHPIELGIVI